MKKYALFALAFVLTAALLVGCGCTNQDMGNTSAPTVLPTNEEVMPTTRETTRPTTAPTTEPATVPSGTGETMDRGNGPLEDTATESTGESGRARSGAGSSSGMVGGSGGTGSSVSRG